MTDRLAVNFGAELTKIVPGRVSTEVDADLSFDTEATIAKARALIAAYEERGVGRDRILIKIASTWEGTQAAAVLQREGIDCNMTLIFSLAQAIACADAKALPDLALRRPHPRLARQGRRRTLHGRDRSRRASRCAQIYAYYKTYGIKTVVMGASFRNIGEIEALAGCDRLTISPQLLGELAKDEGDAAAPARPEVARHAAGADRARREDVPLGAQRGPMATEKLSEGIRLFAKDLAALRKMVEQRLQGRREGNLRLVSKVALWPRPLLFKKSSKRVQGGCRGGG